MPIGFQSSDFGGTGYTTPTVNYTTPTSAFDVSTPGGVSAVTQYINQLNRQGQQQALRARIPGAQGLEQQSSSNISQELQGQVPADVIRLLGQQAAERGARTGQGPGGPNTMAAYLQALGLTSIGQMHQGQQDLTAAYGRNPAAPLFDPTTQLLTPYQQGNLSLQAQEAEDRTRLQQEQLAVERERIAAGADAAAARYAHASGPTGVTSTRSTGFNPGGDLEGYGGEYIVRSPAASQPLGLNIPTDPYGINSWWQPGYANQTGTGSGTFYAGSESGYQNPADFESQFWNDWSNPASTPVGGGGGGGFELPGNDFVSGGYIGSDAPPVDISGG